MAGLTVFDLAGFDLAGFVATSCLASGVPVKVTDAVVLRDVATLLGAIEPLGLSHVPGPACDGS